MIFDNSDLEYHVSMKEAPKVDRAEFNKILGRMIATPPDKKSGFKSPKKPKKSVPDKA